MKAYFHKRILTFRKPAGTSRGVLFHKPSWYIFLENQSKHGFRAIGECSIIPGLSIDNEGLIETKLQELCDKIQEGDFLVNQKCPDFPAVQFAIESAFLDYKAGGTKIVYPSEFTKGMEGIPINGLIWMGSNESLTKQIEDKLQQGFRCIKLKIGQEDFKQRFSVIKELRQRFSINELEIRTDANGTFNFTQAKAVLKMLSDLEVHSIEQPIAPKQWEFMAHLCDMNRIPIALDEELIGVSDLLSRQKLLELIKPHYIILKPSLVGGINESKEWIYLAAKLGIGWWITSALESNIGLNAIAQWTFSEHVRIPQGLGTGSLYQQNVESPLTVIGEKLFYIPEKIWNYEFVS